MMMMRDGRNAAPNQRGSEMEDEESTEEAEIVERRERWWL